jgi:ADP-ribose pyrophosphatase YjhB (NUDIX family)
MTDPAVREPTPHPSTGRTRLGGYAICLDAGERLLLCRLASGEPEPGAWTLPGGGVDFGEHPDEAVIRELREETGLTGTIAGVEGVFSHVYEHSRYFDGADLHFLGILYRVDVTGGDLADEIDGTTDRSAWFSRDEVRELRLVALARQAIELIWPGALA